MDNSSKLIISIYDYTGQWPQPYIEAGYPVMLWDLKHEGDIIKNWGYLIGQIENAIDAGYYPYGLLAAPPCDDFAASGARWWQGKDSSTTACGYRDLAKNSVDQHVWLTQAVFFLMDQVEQLTGHRFAFWAMENPVGRIESLVPEIKPFRKMTFDPCDYGDPYTKKTILWGDFNTNLKKQPVPVTDNRIHHAPGWDKVKQKTIRSTTPAGFATAFFNANQ